MSEIPEEIGPRCEVSAVGDTYADLEMKARTQAARFFNISEADVLLVRSTTATRVLLQKGNHSSLAQGQWEATFVYGLHAPEGHADG